MTKNIFILLLFWGSMALAHTSQENKIREFIKVTGVDKLGQQGANQMIDMFKENYKNIPTEFWDECKKEVSSDELVSLYIPIYAKYYSESDLDELIKFYKTPVGQKMISIMPALMQDSMNAGREWGQKLRKRVSEKINEKYNYQSPPPPLPSK